jgi:hypothetical protein
MTVLSAQTTFTIQDCEAFAEEAELTLLPENQGTDALRELHYPNDLLPPLIYEKMPDRWENFDSEPLTARPELKSEMTLAGNQHVRWPGYQGDRPVKEVWKGDDRRAPMLAYFFRRLWEYYANPPSEGYIVWYPKDRTSQGYYIEIESLTAGGQDTISMDYVALRQGLMVGEVVFAFRIVGEAA